MSNHAPESSCHSFLLNRSSRVLLRVLPVRVKGPAGEVDALALCDEGATVTLMDGSLARQLGLEGDKKPLCLQFVNHGGQFNSMEVDFTIAGVEMGSRSHCVKRAWTVDGLQLPAQAVNIEELQRKFPHLKGLPLKDVGEERPTILLGSDNFRLIAPRIIQEGRGPGPVATKCRLGWSLVGATGSTGGVTQFGVHLCTESDDELHRLVKESFSTESFGVKVMDEQPRSKEDKRATAILANTTVRVKSNRYETGLLWKYEDFTMPSSLATAQHRLRCMERRLDRDPEMAAQYYSKLVEYEEKGYIRKLTPEEAAVMSSRTWYLPHFAVTRAVKPGKIRLVFDAAAKSSNKSLNDFLVKGPDLLQPLPEVIWKFREQPIAFTGDIREMFHQVLIRPEDQNSQLFLWRGRRRDVEPSVYVVNVMTFGAACSPCAATYVKNLNAEQWKEEFPEAYRDIIHNHYVDDYLGGAPSVEAAKQRIRDVIEIHRRVGFEIAHWTTNSREVLESIPADLRSNEWKSIDSDKDLPTEKTLGLLWIPGSYCFTFSTSFTTNLLGVVSGQRNPTKREVLRIVMSLFDPLGFISHFTIKGRILLQRIWRSEIGWDDKLPGSLEEDWRKWTAELTKLTEVKIPRWYGNMGDKAEVDLHIFCDASEQAFSAVAYFRSKNDDDVKTSLVAVKSRVAPFKTLSIPRLELQAAVVAVRMANSIKKGHKAIVRTTTFWTDSRTVLCWIRSDAGRFKQFVAHRIGEILESSDVPEWRWLPTKMNVADDATRDSSNCDFSPEERWISGPSFLLEDEENWPSEPIPSTTIDDDDLELRPTLSISLSNLALPLPDLCRFSKWLRLIRSTAWMMRFIKRVRGKQKDDQTEQGELTLTEMEAAELMWIQQCQWDSFPDETRSLLGKLPLPSSSRLLQLSPLLDANGVLNLKGRLDNLPEGIRCAKQPYILDGRHPYTQLLLAHYHTKMGHLGREAVVNELR
jgi:hypothetical protein